MPAAAVLLLLSDLLGRDILCGPLERAEPPLPVPPLLFMAAESSLFTLPGAELMDCRRLALPMPLLRFVFIELPTDSADTSS